MGLYRLSLSSTNVARRFYGTIVASKLGTLRKRTGFPIGKCKEALSSNSDDLDKAEKWLQDRSQAEGWAKVEKLKDRHASQGLVGLILKGNKAAMLEVNCETDFVARNEKFLTLVSTATKAVFDHPISFSTDAMVSEHFMARDEIGQVKTNSKTLADMAAETVGFLGENLVLQRACVWSASRGTIWGHVYNEQQQDSDDLRSGKYVALVHMLSATGGGFTSNLEELGRSVCKHIIAMNPKVVEMGQGGVTDPTQVLTVQEFVFDESMTVGNMVSDHGAKVTKFVRFAVGENLPKED